MPSLAGSAGSVTSLKRRLLGLNDSHLRYLASRWVLPRLGHEPHTNSNLAERAWPTVGALTAARSYGESVERLEWQSLDATAGAELLAQRARESDPIVLEGYLSEPEQYSLDWIKTEVGETVGPVRVGDYASIPGDADVVRMRAADFVDFAQGRIPFPAPGHVVDGMGPYLANLKLPAISRQLPQSKHFFPEPPVTTFWIGVDSVTPLHCHQFCDVLLIQLTGTRRVALVPPHHAVLVGSVARNINVCTATYDPFEPDGYPGAETIQQPACDLGPGDALLIPGFWFHAVRLTGASSSASQFNEAVMPLAIGGGPRAPWQRRAYQRGWG